MAEGDSNNSDTETSVLELYKKRYLDVSESSKFAAVHTNAYYPVPSSDDTLDFFDVLSMTLDAFLKELNTNSDEEFINDFLSESGYTDSQLETTKVIDAIHNKILQSSSLTEEYLIKDTSNVNVLSDDIKDPVSEGVLSVFNAITYLIENPDVLICATPLDNLSEATSDNLLTYQLFAIKHLLTCSSTESRSNLPKICK